MDIKNPIWQDCAYYGKCFLKARHKAETCECCGRDLPVVEICEHCGHDNHKLQLGGRAIKRIRKDIEAERSINQQKIIPERNE